MRQRGVVPRQWEEAGHDQTDRSRGGRRCIVVSIGEEGETEKRRWVGVWVVNVVLVGTLFRRLKRRPEVGWTWVISGAGSVY